MSQPVCSFGKKCAKLNDPRHMATFAHPHHQASASPQQPSSNIKCRYGDKCNREDCLYDHGVKNLLKNPYSSDQQRPNNQKKYAKKSSRDHERSDVKNLLKNPYSSSQQRSNDNQNKYTKPHHPRRSETSETSETSSDDSEYQQELDNHKIMIDMYKEEVEERDAEIKRLKRKIKEKKEEIEQLKSSSRR